MGIVKKLHFRVKLALANEWQRAAVYSQQYGVKFGSRVRITGSVHFGSEPYLISIGDDVTLTQDVTFHTHDGGVGIFRRDYPGINVYGRISVGNNVFVGSNVIVMPGVSIGNNVVIGAGSVVTRDVPDNVVVAGAPAKQIRTIDEYKQHSLSRAVFIKGTTPEERKREILEHLRLDQ